MSNTNTIKRHNHRVHACLKERKQDLLKHLITLYEGKDILVLSSTNTVTTEVEAKNLTLTNDKELAEMRFRKWDVLISFDLPTDADIYMKRLNNITSTALIIVSPEEEALLYPLDMALGKNLPRVVIPGYEILKARPKNPPHRPTKSQVAEEEAAKDRVREKQAKIREYAEKRGEEVSAEDLKKVEDDETKYLKDSKADKKEQKNGSNSFGKKEWDKKPSEYKGKSSTTRQRKVIVLPAKKAAK